MQYGKPMAKCRGEVYSEMELLKDWPTGVYCRTLRPFRSGLYEEIARFRGAQSPFNPQALIVAGSDF